MGLFRNRRFWSILAFNGAVLCLLYGAYAASHRSAAPVEAPTPSSTPSPVPEARSTPAAPAPTVATTPGSEGESYQETGPQDAIQLGRLRSTKVKVTQHKVKLKENYWSVAKDNHIDVYTLIGANPDLPYKAGINQNLNILSRKGVLHTVGKGETPALIARKYRVEAKVLQDENGLTWWRSPREGDVLFIPDVRPIRMSKEWHNYFTQRGFFGDPLGTWGRWTSNFGMRIDPFTGEGRLHKGMDLRAKYGDPVYAAASGRVVFAGVSGGYGNLIQIRHNSTYLTMYGHLSKLLVRSGQKVKRGTLIGKVGATGRVTGPHLHFEIRKNGKAINPLPLI